MSFDFVAVDVETANEDLTSICQVGIASFRDGNLVDTWESLINPEDYFSPVNISIHGIDESKVEGAPTWSEAFAQIGPLLQDVIVVSHTPFDRLALQRACNKSGLEACEWTWLDSARVVRRAWPQFSKSGYGLSNVASCFGISYKAHNALEDARCAGLLLLRAVADTGIDVDGWLTRVRQPIDPAGQSHKREGNPDGALCGEVLVFTGELSLSRQEAADVASAAGCRVDANVTKHTTMLVTGDQDLRKLAGRTQSAKQLKAEELIRKGQQIRILGESDFLRVVSLSSEAPVTFDS